MTQARDELLVLKDELEEVGEKRVVRMKELEGTNRRLRMEVDQLSSKLSQTQSSLDFVQGQLEIFKRAANSWEEKFHE